MIVSWTSLPTGLVDNPVANQVVSDAAHGAAECGGTLCHHMASCDKGACKCWPDHVGDGRWCGRVSALASNSPKTTHVGGGSLGDSSLVQVDAVPPAKKAPGRATSTVSARNLIVVADCLSTCIPSVGWVCLAGDFTQSCVVCYAVPCLCTCSMASFTRLTRSRIATDAQMVVCVHTFPNKPHGMCAPICPIAHPARAHTPSPRYPAGCKSCWTHSNLEPTSCLYTARWQETCPRNWQKE